MNELGRIERIGINSTGDGKLDLTICQEDRNCCAVKGIDKYRFRGNLTTYELRDCANFSLPFLTWFRVTFTGTSWKADSIKVFLTNGTYLSCDLKHLGDRNEHGATMQIQKLCKQNYQIKDLDHGFGQSPYHYGPPSNGQFG